ncbi:hypothetical protein [Metaclostridioides mangenotii]|uniref:DNA polymerase II small subunit/DNA polymerase delta subunit B n=1 Tax=Metaclostridioides mangenotii TaxID=1540 RepID=A0ABS4EBV6_9FIRM|nr:hypothetical protein [Clostridioides mangenotii]MBP1855412.1 DNA polymerase II small subunit/DNA polymerase delta subunit B [Clostridioides mangenotii]
MGRKKAYLIIVISLVLFSLVGCDSNSASTDSKPQKQEEIKKDNSNEKEVDKSNIEEKTSEDNAKSSKQDKETPDRKEGMSDDEYLKYLKEIAENTSEIAENTRKKPKKIYKEENVVYYNDISGDKENEGRDTSEKINVNTNNNNKDDMDLDGVANDLNN